MANTAGFGYHDMDKDPYGLDAGQFDGNLIEHIEKIAIIKALTRFDGNQIEAAKLLGLHRNTLHNKIKKFKIDVGRFKT